MNSIAIRLSVLFAVASSLASAQLEEVTRGCSEAMAPAPTMPAETTVVVLEFKDINVFEYDLDLVFMQDDSAEVWFPCIGADIAEIGLYTVEDNNGFPVYEVNADKVGRKYRVSYIETTVEGEFSGEPEQVKEIVGLEEVIEE